MKKTLCPHSLLFVFIFLSVNLFSQINSYDRWWYFGPYNAWDWSSGSPVAVAGCVMNNVEGSHTTNDISGNLLFYGGDDKIYNATGGLMPNSVGLNCTTTPKQGPISVQVPNNPNRYYYIYPGGAGSPLKYSIIDMTLQTGLGDVDNAFKNITLRAVNAEGCMAIPRLNTCNEIWVLSHGLSNDFYLELISPTGIANFATTNIGPVSTSMGGYMDYSPVTGKLAFLYGNFNVGLCDFNAATGAITNFVNVQLPPVPFCLEYYSLAFSPSGDKLYVGGGYGQNYLVQVDLANANFVTTIATGSGGNQLKLGPDGKIYGQLLYTSQVGIVNNPNNAGLACNYVANVINTGNVTYSDIGFPSMVVVPGGSLVAGITGNSIICSGSSTTLTGSGGGNYSWSTGATTSTITITPTTNTIYTVYVTNGNCSDSATQSVTVSPTPTGSITGNNSVCANSPTILTGGGGGTYSWSTGATTSAITVTPSVNTTYTLYVSNGNCTDTVTQTVTINPSPTANIAGTISICLGSSTILTASGGGTYLWNTSATTGAITISPTSTTSYTVTVTNGNGCTDTATVGVVVNNVPIAIVSGDTIICAGQNTILTAGTGANYLWNTGATTSVISVYPTTNTSYTAIVSNGNCSDTATINVIVNPSPTASAGASVTISLGSQTTLTANGGGNYLWSNGATTQSISVSPTATTTYCVQVTNTNNCTDSSCVTVYVDIQCGDLFIPTAFSPNNDGQNDFFYVLGNCITSMHLVVYDRWGEKVFETTDQNQKWDGIYKNKPMNTAVFVYKLEADLITGGHVSEKGNVTLVR